MIGQSTPRRRRSTVGSVAIADPRRRRGVAETEGETFPPRKGLKTHKTGKESRFCASPFRGFRLVDAWTTRRCSIAREHGEVVIASDSEATQTKPQMRSPSLDCFALLAMTVGQTQRQAPAVDSRAGA
jgi:hypothetical protein